MSYYCTATNEEGQPTVNLTLNSIPDECPQCHNKGTFSALASFYNARKEDDTRLQVTFRCPNSKCRNPFIGYYTQPNTGQTVFFMSRVAPGRYVKKAFPEIVEGISKDFSLIYNQALEAEHYNLDQICGPGYRKALEFLVKDYAIKQTTDSSVHEEIKKESLGDCISKRIKSENIKSVAKRAVWLGNDETHYVRKWGEKDLADLKRLIDITLHWIEEDELTKAILSEMPEPQKEAVKQA